MLLALHKRTHIKRWSFFAIGVETTTPQTAVLIKRAKELVERRRKIVRRDNGKVVEFEEVRYGRLMMGLCDREG